MSISSCITYHRFINRHKNISSLKNGFSENNINSVPNFYYLTDDVDGPITTNKELDDGTKTIIHSLMLEHVDKSDDEILNKSRVAIVMFSSSVKTNSLAEHAISEIYQYANIHKYKFLFYNERYDKDREPFYMKIHSLNEALVYGLYEREYEWVMWIDTDVILANPNIKLETFLPKDENIHFIAADRNGLNAGVFFLRVHPWSLNFLNRVLSYGYFNNDKALKYPEEAALNNILIEYKESKHYVIVPHHWFNTYPDKKEKGDFLLHFCYRKSNGGDSKQIRNEIREDLEYISAKTNEKLRKEVINYYRYKRKNISLSLRTS